MLDLLLIPVAILAILALRAARQGAHRPHGHLMTGVFGCLVLRGILASRNLLPDERKIGTALLVLLGTTVLMGRGALAWREGNMIFARFPRIHRALGAFSLLCLAVALAAWMLYRRH